MERGGVTLEGDWANYNILNPNGAIRFVDVSSVACRCVTLATENVSVQTKKKKKKASHLSCLDVKDE